jgi:hypothetical protein
MNVLDRARIEWAVLSYSHWLELRGARGRRRRELRRELRDNLVQAAHDGGARRAVAALGSTRQMAAEAVPDDPMRPRWALASTAGLSALVIALTLELMAGLIWAEGAGASGQREVSGSLLLFPGSSLRYVEDASSLTFELTFGWLSLAVAALVFLLAAKPWRALRRSGEEGAGL